MIHQQIDFRARVVDDDEIHFTVAVQIDRLQLRDAIVDGKNFATGETEPIRGRLRGGELQREKNDRDGEKQTPMHSGATVGGRRRMATFTLTKPLVQKGLSRYNMS